MKRSHHYADFEKLLMTTKLVNKETLLIWLELPDILSSPTAMLEDIRVNTSGAVGKKVLTLLTDETK